MQTTPTRSDEYAEPHQLAARWHTTPAALAKQRYFGTGPAFLKIGRKVLYPWAAIHEYERENTQTSTERPGAA